ncbi:hypothetical protein CDIK_3315 [Cucumispora dikerogammari]|nr:hypothetical protein CDIK_3315 [Cucumispora dikerogammari]
MISLKNTLYLSESTLPVKQTDNKTSFFVIAEINETSRPLIEGSNTDAEAPRGDLTSVLLKCRLNLLKSMKTLTFLPNGSSFKKILAYSFLFSRLIGEFTFSNTLLAFFNVILSL